MAMPPTLSIVSPAFFISCIRPLSAPLTESGQSSASPGSYYKIMSTIVTFISVTLATFSCNNCHATCFTQQN